MQAAVVRGCVGFVCVEGCLDGLIGSGSGSAAIMVCSSIRGGCGYVRAGEM